jgi:hypothetical protein
MHSSRPPHSPSPRFLRCTPSATPPTDATQNERSRVALREPRLALSVGRMIVCAVSSSPVRRRLRAASAAEPHASAEIRKEHGPGMHAHLTQSRRQP